MKVFCSIWALLLCVPVFAADTRSGASAAASIGEADASLVQLARNAAPRIKAASEKSVPVPSSEFGLLFDANVPEATRRQMNEDISFAAGVHGSGASSLHQAIFGPVSGPAYRQFFTSRIKSVGLVDSKDAAGLAAVVVGPQADHSKMLLESNYIKASVPQIYRVSILFHEARHTEDQNGNWHHAVCPALLMDPDVHLVDAEDLAGKEGCDRSAMGSYGLQVVMLKNIQKRCTNCSDKVKMDAGLFGDHFFTRIIDSEAQNTLRQDLYQRASKQ